MARYAPWVALTVTVLGVVAASEEHLADHVFEATLAAACLAVIWLLIERVINRVSLMRDVYVMAYRHGRRDANNALLESELHIKAVARQRE